MVASGGRLRSRSLTAVRRSYLGRADQIALRLWEKAGIGTVFCLKKLVTFCPATTPTPRGRGD